MTDGFEHPEFLVQTAWLADHLADPTVRIFDCTTHLIPDPKGVYTVLPGRADFEKGHIPGAQFIDLQADLSDNTQRLRFMKPDAETFAASMRRLGVSQDSRVILYSGANVWWATRAWWLLRVFGFDNAAVLDGGLQKWTREARPTAIGPATPAQPGNFTVKEERPLMADKAAVLKAIGDGAICTVNALLPAQHKGEGGTSYGRPGHIAGSVNVPAAHLINPDTNTFRSAAELRASFDAIGAMDRAVITYCGGGIAASADSLALIMLGHQNVKLYDASLSEWVADPALPMELG